MDTSNPAPLVNGELLKRYTGRRVRCVLKVVRPEGNAAFAGLSSDGVQVSVKQASPIAALSQFVEVIGIADSDRSLRAEICTNFGENFDSQLYEPTSARHLLPGLVRLGGQHSYARAFDAFYR